MVLALLTFHPLMSWLIAEAAWNICLKSVTCSTCHEPRGWLKVLADLNIRYIVVTLETSHALISSSKLCLLWKRSLMSVTAPTSQSEIEPYLTRADVALLVHSARAFGRSVLAL